MSLVNRRYIDKHWLVYVLRGSLAALFGLLMLFNCLEDTGSIALPIGLYLLCIGAIDSVNSIYSSHKRHGWVNSLSDAVVDVIAALTLLFIGRDSLIASVVILAVYTFLSGLIDVIHGFISTVDPTDKFIRLLIGVFGCIIGVVIFNAGNFDIVEFYRFFGVYVLLVGVTSLIYGAHNRAQITEAREMMHEIAEEHKHEHDHDHKHGHKHEAKAEVKSAKKSTKKKSNDKSK